MKAQRVVVFVTMFLIIVLLVMAVLVMTILLVHFGIKATSGTETEDSSKSSNATGTPGGKSATGRYNVVAVASDNEICSQVGRNLIVYRGGSSVDGAIAVLVCLGLVNAQHTGLGGGFNAIIRERPNNGTDELLMIALNARETTPLWAHRDMFNDDISSSYKSGPRSITVPGEVNGYYEAWKLFGRVPWRDLFLPTIRLARHGWPVSESMATIIMATLDAIRADQGLSELLLKSDGTPYQKGDTMRNPKLAAVLTLIAEQGPAAFYNGSISDDMLRDLHDIGAGNFMKEDLLSNKATFVAPLETSLESSDGYLLATPPPPSTGIIIEFILKLMDGYRYTKSSIKSIADEVLFDHRIIESWKMAFARSEYLGDLTFDNLRQSQLVNALLNDTYIDKIRRRIQDHSVLNSYQPGSDPSYDFADSTGGTTGIAIATADGAGVAVTATIGSLFGCQRRGQRTGIVFNNGFDLYTLPTKTNISTNYIEPRKHGRSMAGPLLAISNFTRQVALVSAGSGSQRIPTAISLITARTLFLGYNVTYSTDKPRFHHQLNPNILYIEHLSQDIVHGLRENGHDHVNRTRSANMGVIQTIQVVGCSDCPEGLNLESVSDFRKGSDSKPSGF